MYKIRYMEDMAEKNEVKLKGNFTSLPGKVPLTPRAKTNVQNKVHGRYGRKR
jgi:hypothetical protein